ncbi:thermonuclease family protein [Bordetella holmesii]|nr:thermonuclease family protein [Bordetella holmesii]KCV10801.1 nuclease-like protein [Bordetella holmesii 04P3421]MBO1240181.1 thermonuclease family protein [Bordetella holmesii]MBO1244130.1 thermonuclease family protein [Bordetella holmesii]MBO1247267.1 thermonuclease family protein [Bordetella holmesii]MBO1252288.1 thermonuclease family protein [Bordetella holmesii]
MASLAAALAVGAVVAWFQVDHSRPATPGPAGAGAGLPVASYEIHGTVVSVADGDTVTLRSAGGQRRIRLDSIDAPEAGHGRDEPGQPYAEASRQHLAALVTGKNLTAQCYEKDQYGRDLCALMLPDGRSVNREQVAAGNAWAYTARRGDYLRDKAMPELQRRAREARLGLWAEGGAMEPWKWRYDCWKEKRC